MTASGARGASFCFLCADLYSAYYLHLSGVPQTSTDVVDMIRLVNDVFQCLGSFNVNLSAV